MKRDKLWKSKVSFGKSNATNFGNSKHFFEKSNDLILKIKHLLKESNGQILEIKNAFDYQTRQVLEIKH